VPNEIFCLGLSANAIAIYGYLLSIEDRKTYQCWPSYKTIGKATGMSSNTVRKYVTELEERGLIHTEHTTVTTRDGQKRNGNLLYHVRPIQAAVEQFHQRQLSLADLEQDRWQTARKLAAAGMEERPV
jgi:DNA-binding transcriptional regulator YhcF (GntR family)